ncbi:MAG: hypothetical protein E7182_00270 [Erysipelotrichaceae bacterium]|nr:hypothetical protein [Erysipelotrichaceae bacterium]
MKKITVLMLLPMVALTGCNNAKVISEAEAKTIIEQINAKQKESPINEFKLIYDETVDGVKATNLTEYSEPKTYFHILDGDLEAWAYAKDSKYYFVNHDSSEGTEVKEYYEFGEDGKVVFDLMSEEIKQNATAEFNDFGILDLEAMKNEYVPGLEVNFQYTTEGEGSLNFSAECKWNSEGLTERIVLNGSYKDYRPYEFTYLGEGSVDGVSYKEEYTMTYQYTVNPTYPDLTGYTKLTAEE